MQDLILQDKIGCPSLMHRYKIFLLSQNHLYWNSNYQDCIYRKENQQYIFKASRYSSKTLFNLLYCSIRENILFQEHDNFFAAVILPFL